MKATVWSFKSSEYLWKISKELTLAEFLIANPWISPDDFKLNSEFWISNSGTFLWLQSARCYNETSDKNLFSAEKKLFFCSVSSDLQKVVIAVFKDLFLNSKLSFELSYLLIHKLFYQFLWNVIVAHVSINKAYRQPRALWIIVLSFQVIIKWKFIPVAFWQKTINCCSS